MKHYQPPRGSHGCPPCSAEYERARGSPAARGYDRKWKKLRDEAIARSPRCEDCGATERLEGDHRKPVSQGGRARTVADVRVLCRSCNAARGGRLATSRGSREAPPPPDEPLTPLVA